MKVTVRYIIKVGWNENMVYPPCFELKPIELRIIVMEIKQINKSGQAFTKNN